MCKLLRAMGRIFSQYVVFLFALCLSPFVTFGDLAVHILKDAPASDCLAHECKILVVNFAMPAGVNPAYGSALADDLSKQLTELQKEVQVFNRGLLKTYAAVTTSTGTPPKSDEEARELARGLGAGAVVTGSAKKLPDDSFTLSVRLLSVKDASSAGGIEEAHIPPAPAARGTSPSYAADAPSLWCAFQPLLGPVRK